MAVRDETFDECPPAMKGMINKDIDRLFLFVDPLELEPKPLKQERVNYTYPDQISPDFVATLQRLITSVKDILNDPKTDPLVENAKDLQATVEVCEFFVVSFVV